MTFLLSNYKKTLRIKQLFDFATYAIRIFGAYFENEYKNFKFKMAFQLRDDVFEVLCRFLISGFADIATIF